MLRLVGLGRNAVRCLRTSAPALGVVGYKLADIGEGITEVEITKWHVSEGDMVKEFDPICEVQSDKANVEITSRYEGKITTIRHAVGDMAKVGESLLDIDVEGMDAEAAPEKEEAKEEKSTAAAPVGGGQGSRTQGSEEQPWTPRDIAAGEGKVLTTPAVRHLARTQGVDLSLVSGTGRGGRVLKEDVLAYVASGGAQQQQQQQQQATGGSSATSASAGATTVTPARAPRLSAGLAAAVAAPPSSTGAIGPDVVDNLKGVRRAMVKTMTASCAVPHFGFSDEFEMSALARTRETLKPLMAARGISLSYLPLLIKSLSMALTRFPLVNSTLTGDGGPDGTGPYSVTRLGSHNIGVAMDTPLGLVVPNIKGVQNLSVSQVASELERLRGLAQAGQLGPADLSGGTITVSNIGNIGGTYLSPVLMPGEAAIVALGRMQRVPRFASDDSDVVTAARVMNVSFSCDHRVLDGATVASMSALWKEYIENPELLIADMA